MGFTLNQLEQERQIRKLQKKEDKDTSNYEQLSNLPKINNVELKGNKTTSDLGINADNVMLSDGVTSVEDRMDAANIASSDDISSYTSSSNMYTCPSDGFVRISGTTSTMATLYLMNKELTLPYTLLQTNTAYVSIFMRKGAKIYVSNANSALFLSLS